MKTKLITTLGFIILNVLLLAASPKGTKTSSERISCLKISGKVAGVNKEKCNGVIVRLYHNNQVVDSVVTTSGKVFGFTLNRNTFYTIKISCLGYASKKISIDTELPDFIAGKQEFRFHFDTSLINDEKVEEIDLDKLDFPIALVKYQMGKGWFDYSRKYTSKIKSELLKKGHK